MARPRIQDAEKRCPKCGITKSANEFPRNRSRPDGLNGYCKPCQAAHNENWRKRNPEKIAVAGAKRRASNKERFASVARRWRKENPQRVAEYRKARRRRDANKVKARDQLAQAVRSGRVQKPERCESCDQQAELQGHHEDYSKPLDVAWLCEPCHRVVHGRLLLIDQDDKGGGENA